MPQDTRPARYGNRRLLVGVPLGAQLGRFASDDSGETLIVRHDKDKDSLAVTDGNDTGHVTWHPATHKYRGDFQGWGSDADTVERAVDIAARRITTTSQGVPETEAVDAMGAYIYQPVGKFD